MLNLLNENKERNIFEESSKHADRLILESPILDRQTFEIIRDSKLKKYPVGTINLNYDKSLDLEESITQLGNIVDDLQILSDNVMENEECTTDDIVNILTGTITVQQFRMNKAIEILEYLIETKK